MCHLRRDGEPLDDRETADQLHGIFGLRARTPEADLLHRLVVRVAPESLPTRLKGSPGG